MPWMSLESTRTNRFVFASLKMVWKRLTISSTQICGAHLKLVSVGCYISCCSGNTASWKHQLHEREGIWLLQSERREIKLPSSNSSRATHVRILISFNDIKFKFHVLRTSIFIFFQYSSQVWCKVTGTFALPTCHSDSWWQHYEALGPRFSSLESWCIGENCVF